MARVKFIFIIICCTFLPNIHAQQSYQQSSIHIPAQNLSIPALLEMASKQCSCYFSYPSQLFNDEKININPSFNGTLHDFIQHFLGEDISYTIFKNQIILQEDKKKTTLPEQKDIIEISANIVDSSTHKAIPYASVLIEETMLGTSANGDGLFHLKLPAELKDKTIQISCLGYYSASYPVAELQQLKKIALSPANFSLQEVIVRSVGSHYVVDKAIENFKLHYRRESYNYTSFYREMAYRNTEQLSYTEALFKGYSPKNKGMRQDDLVIAKARKFIPAPSQRDSIILKLKGGTEAALRLDIARYPTDFLSTERNELYLYKIVDIQSWKDQLVYVVSFTPRSGINEAQFEGELYISFEDYILLGAEFKYTQQMLYELRYHLIVSKDRRTRVKPQQYLYHVEYQSYKDLYHLNYIRGDIIIKAKNKNAWRYQNFNTVFEMVLTELETKDKKKVKTDTKYKTSSIFSDAIEFSPIEFWRFDNVIIPEQEIMDAFSQSGFMLEEEE